jgi:hypothetical protein
MGDGSGAGNWGEVNKVDGGELARFDIDLERPHPENAAVFKEEGSGVEQVVPWRKGDVESGVGGGNALDEPSVMGMDVEGDVHHSLNRRNADGTGGGPNAMGGIQDGGVTADAGMRRGRKNCQWKGKQG